MNTFSLGSMEFMLGANTAGLTRATGNMRRFETQVLGSNARMQSSFQALGSSMMLAGTMMTMYLTVPIALLATAGVVAFAKYETQMAKIVALTGTTQAQANSWSHDILSMSKEFGQAPKDVAAAMYFIASPALKASTAMDVLKASSMGAAIGLGDVQVIGKALVNIINAYGESNITASHALDVMLTATKNGVMEASDLASALGKILPTAQALGVGFEDLTGSIAALTLTGKTANEASTQLNRLFSTLIQARPRAEKVLKSFGISFEDLRTTLRDKGMMATIQQLSTMIGGSTLDEIQNTKAFKDNIDVLGDVFTNLRALLPVLDMLGPNMKNWENILNNVTKASGSAATAWNVISGKVAKRFEIAVANMQVSLIGFGETIKEPVIGLMQSLARWVENLSNWFQSLSSSTQKNIIGWAAFFVVLGPVLLIGGQIVGMLVSVGTALSALGVIMLAHPWVRFATAAVLLAGALYSMFNNYTKLNGVQQALHDVSVKANKSLIDQTIIMQRLINVAQNDLTDKEIRLDAIKQLNAISPKYLGFLNEENITTRAAITAINKYLDSLYAVEEYKAAIEAQDANRKNKMQLVADPVNSLTGWNDFFDSIGKGYMTHRKYLNFIIKGLDDEYNALLKITHEYELQEDLLNRFAKIQTSEKPYAADKAKAKLKAAAMAAKDFWNKYAGEDVSGKMNILDKLLEPLVAKLVTLMTTKTPTIDNSKALANIEKEIDLYSKKWVALDKLKRLQDDLLLQARKIAANQPIQLLGADTKNEALSKYLSASKGLSNGFNKKLEGVGNDPFASTMFNTDLATRKGGMADIIKYTQDYTRGLQDVIDKKAMLGKSYNLELEQNKVEITYYEEKLKYMRDNGLAVGDTISQLGLLYNAQKKLESSIPVLEAWRSLFRDVASLIGTIGKYMGEEFQKVFGVIQDIVSGVGEFIRIIKDIMTITKLTATVTTAAQIAQTTATAVSIPVVLGAAAAQETLAIASTNAAVAGAAASTSWIPIVGVGLAIAGVAALLIMLNKSHKSTGMATGGTVPSGFPNDSFPAMLTTGETVIPLTKMAEIFGKGAKTGQQQVVFKIHRKELVGILQDAAITGRSF